MAPSTTHKVLARDVVDMLPFNTQYVTQSTSTPINFTLVESWVERGAGILNALMASKGIDPLTLDLDAAEIARLGVMSYARMRALTKLDADESEIREASDEWKDVRKVIRAMPEELGVSGASGVHTNVDTQSAPDTPWGEDFGGW